MGKRGAARGMAHIGVLRALGDAGQKPGCVAGTSIGALVGGVYAAGKLDELTAIVLDLDWKRDASFFLEASFPRSGLIEGNKVTEFLAKILGRRKIRDLPIPFCAVATEITSGREVVIDDGDLVDAIRASISAPGVFSPAERGGDLLVDGGLIDPVPVCVCRAMGAERVIAKTSTSGACDRSLVTPAAALLRTARRPSRNSSAPSSKTNPTTGRVHDAGKRKSIETITLNLMPLLRILLLYFLPYRRISGYCI